MKGRDLHNCLETVVTQMLGWMLIVELKIR